MKAARFISKGIAFRSKAASVSIAVGVAVMIVAMAVASGFRSEIYDNLSELFGDIKVDPLSGGEERDCFIDSVSFYSELICCVEGVAGVKPVLSRPGVLKTGDEIHGVLFKGSEELTEDRALVIPRKLSSLLSLSEGDRVLGYFVSDRVSIRNFEVGGVYESIVTDDDKLVVYCSNDMLRRVMGCGGNQAASLEVMLAPGLRDAEKADAVCREISLLLYENTLEDSPVLIAETVRRQYSKLFEWLGMVDMNVNLILVLMVIVAAFNMVSALLILLFQNISTIGVLKTLGMTNGGIATTFLLSCGKAVLGSMLCGNVLALALCLVQQRFHIITLNPDNYFVSFVPIHMDMGFVLACDVAAFAVIMLVLLIPCAFISRVEASRSVDYR